LLLRNVPPSSKLQTGVISPTVELTWVSPTTTRILVKLESLPVPNRSYSPIKCINADFASSVRSVST
jgi:hypothetical protein